MQVTRREHAVAFSNGMEYFATCGGCTAAGAAGLAVMSVVASEGLQARPNTLHRLRALETTFLRVLGGGWHDQVLSPYGMQARAADTGSYLVGRLRTLQERFPILGDVRGTGLMIGIEVRADAYIFWA